MTREHKLSLVLGFGLLLFVGILLSDHFSAAQRREHADLVATAPERARPNAGPISIQPLPAAQQVAFRGNGQAQGTMDGSADGMPMGVQPQVQYSQQVAQGAGEVPAELYTIKAGESLYKICQVKYGDGTLWKSLAEFNKSTIPNPTKLRAGMTIRIPSASVLKGESPAPAQVQSALPPTGMMMPSDATMAPATGGMDGAVVMGVPQTAATEQPAPAPATREYTVQKGDTLSSIASKKLGSKGKWKQIADLNRDRLNDPHGLSPGTVIRIPN